MNCDVAWLCDGGRPDSWKSRVTAARWYCIEDSASERVGSKARASTSTHVISLAAIHERQRSTGPYWARSRARWMRHREDRAQGHAGTEGAVYIYII